MTAQGEKERRDTERNSNGKVREAVETSQQLAEWLYDDGLCTCERRVEGGSDLERERELEGWEVFGE